MANLTLTPKQEAARKAAKVKAFAGGGIEYFKIPRDGDVFDFGHFWGYRDAKGNWFIPNWSGSTSMSSGMAHTELGRLTRATAVRMAQSKGLSMLAGLDILEAGWYTPEEIRNQVRNRVRKLKESA